MFSYIEALYTPFNPQLGVLEVRKEAYPLFTNPNHFNWNDALYAYLNADFGNLVDPREHVYNLLAAARGLPTTGRYALGKGVDGVTVHTIPEQERTVILPSGLAQVEFPLSRPYLFDHGTVVATPGAIDLYNGDDRPMLGHLSRHCRGDWGNVCREDAAENELSLKEGFRLLSSYGVREERCWIISEADRSISTFVLPTEY